jgi:DNA-binding transcriptional LysR family regulator
VEGSLDLALISVPERFPPQLEMPLLFEDPMVFVCRRDHPLASNRSVRLPDIGADDLVGFPPGFGLRRLMDNALHAAGVQSRTPYEVPAGFSEIAALVRTGLGTAFMPVSEAERFGDLRAVELVDPVLWQVYLAAPPTERLTPAAARLADALRKAGPAGLPISG